MAPGTLCLHAAWLGSQFTWVLGTTQLKSAPDNSVGPRHATAATRSDGFGGVLHDSDLNLPVKGIVERIDHSGGRKAPPPRRRATPSCLALSLLIVQSPECYINMRVFFAGLLAPATGGAPRRAGIFRPSFGHSVTSLTVLRLGPRPFFGHLELP